MEMNEIREQVVKQIDRWKAAHNRKDEGMTLSDGAIDFICLVIQNIEDDQSKNWNNFPDIYNKQERAISLIPDVLSEIHKYYGYKAIEVSSWEIWHAFTPILNGFCFIPKKK